MEKGASTRRRRLVERGSDRLAFITGKASSLPSDPLPDSPLTPADTSTQLSEQQKVEGGIGGDQFNNRTLLQKSEPIDLVPDFHQAEARQETKVRTLSIEDELFLKFKTGSAVPEIQPLNEASLHRHGQETINEAALHRHDQEDELFLKFKTGSAVPEIQPLNEAPLHRHGEETINEAPLRRHDQEEDMSKKTGHDGASSIQPTGEIKMRPRSAPPSQSNQSDDAGWSMETLKEHLNFTPREITQAISATENNRFLASVTIAFLVVLSNWGLDIGGTITRILVGTRPLLFLIITNITIVLTLLMENKDPNARSRPVGSNMGSVDSLGQMLGIGLLLQKALGALLIDCSVCAVIMICFLGF